MGAFVKAADKLGEILEDAAVYTGRIMLGTSHELAVSNHIRNRIKKGELFNFSGSGVKFSTTGKIMVAGWGIKNALTSANEGYQESKLGTPSGETLSATPPTRYTQFFGEGGGRPVTNASQEAADYINEESYYNSSVGMGATGDLVFAMNANRRG